MTNKTLVGIRVRVWVWVKAWIKIYIRHTENTELLPNLLSLPFSRLGMLTSCRHDVKVYVLARRCDESKADLFISPGALIIHSNFKVIGAICTR